MRLLHTSDWHVGKRLRGRSRLDEHQAVLAEIVSVADSERPDITLVVGDLFEHAVPAPDARALVWQALLDLRETGTKVVVVAGNHDSAAEFEAMRPLFARLGMHVSGYVHRPDDGGVVEIDAGGQGARIVTLPFLSPRYSVRAEDLIRRDAAERAGTYRQRITDIVSALCATGFADDTVNLIAAHAFVTGGTRGGGERDAHCLDEFGLDVQAFPSSAAYVALGHLHCTQKLPSLVPVWYSGSPIQVDFGEELQTKNVLLIEASADTPAVVDKVALTSGWELRRVTGSFEELEAMAPELAGDPDGPRFLRVTVVGPRRAGLAEEVRALLPNAVEVRIESTAGHGDGRSVRPSRVGASPVELFGQYCAEVGISDERVAALFRDLHLEVS